MTELQIKLEELKSFLIDDGYNDSNIVYQTLADAQELAINCSQCCKSDSEQLVCEKCNGTGGYSYTDEIGFNYKTCECQTN